MQKHRSVQLLHGRVPDVLVPVSSLPIHESSVDHYEGLSYCQPKLLEHLGKNGVPKIKYAYYQYNELFEFAVLQSIANYTN